MATLPVPMGIKDKFFLSPFASFFGKVLAVFEVN